MTEVLTTPVREPAKEARAGVGPVGKGWILTLGMEESCA
jgi:hypothetical protein